MTIARQVTARKAIYIQYKNKEVSYVGSRDPDISLEEIDRNSTLVVLTTLISLKERQSLEATHKEISEAVVCVSTKRCE
jgi:hypothetical protein